MRIKGYDYSSEGGYFITVVIKNRFNFLGEAVDGIIQYYPLGEIVEKYWLAIPQHFSQIELGSFVIMPNHVHGIIFINDKSVGARHASPLLGTIIGSFKSAVTRQAGRDLGLKGIWQRNYYDHIIRDQQDLEQISSYILDNPR